MILLASSGCSQAFSESANDILFIESKILFDSDGDGVKSDVAVLSALGGTGGYGQHRLEVYAEDRQKLFDSIDCVINHAMIPGLPTDAIIDSIYSAKASDTDGDGGDELVCRQYAWCESHSNHIGDVVSVLKKNGDAFKIVDAWFEACK